RRGRRVQALPRPERFRAIPAYLGEKRTMRRTSKAFALSSMLGPLAFGSGALAQDGSEVDLTGTWEGTQVCDDLIGGEFVNFGDNEHRLLIVQDGDSFRLLYTAKPEGEIADDLVYEGVVQN